MRQFVIGTRGSDLALWQASMVRSRLAAAFPETNLEIKIIKTTGDEMQEVALSKVGDKGLFTRQIETELLNGNIDLAVHSLKDLQTEEPDGLVIGAVCKREKPNDILISRDHGSIDSLPPNARIATGSLRRRSQLLNLRPDLEIVEIRGNVPTRIEKFLSSDLDGLILAYAGVHRLGLTEKHKYAVIPTDTMIPAVGQGAVAVEMRADDPNMAEVTSVLDHAETAACTNAERAFLRRLEGGCQVPIGALAKFEGADLVLTGFVGSLDGRTAFLETATGTAAAAASLGDQLAERLIEKGAAELVRLSRESTSAAGRVL